ncbi:MAG: MlaD family protein [Spirochaetes bacterium]|nr:MlaD family protein [Spirochaetota bacterium]
MSRLLKIGLFVLITSVATVVYIMRTADRVHAKETYTVAVVMDDASGLYVDSNVRLAGVNVGKIRAIELVEGKAKLTLELSKDVRLYEDARVVKTLESMLGTSAVQVYPGNRVERPLPAGGIIQNAVSANVMDQTFLGAAELTDEIRGLVKDLRRFLSDEGGYSTLKEILNTAKDVTKTTNLLVQKNLNLLSTALENINAITQTLRMNTLEDRQKLSQILQSTLDITIRLNQVLIENQESIGQTVNGLRDSVVKLQTTIDRVNASLAQIDTTAAQIGEAANKAGALMTKVGTAVDQANVTLTQIGSVAQNVNKVVDRVNAGEGNIGKLLHDETLYNNIVNISGRVEEYINSTMGMELQIGFQSELLMRNLDSRNQLGIRLNPLDTSKYYLLGIVDSPRLSETKKETTVVKTTNTITSYTTLETERQRKLLINAQIARRFGQFALRGGVIESTGGIGLDFHPFNGLVLSSELFDFTQKGGPYLRAYGTVYPMYNPRSKNPLQWLYLTGGVDNAILKERDFFMGLGLRFTDNDLKALSGSLPSINP